MQLPRLLFVLGLMAVCGTACVDRPRDVVGADAPPADLRGTAAALYEQYGAALASGRREALPRFYHPDGALLVFNGSPMRLSMAQLSEIYTTQWSPPAYFAWDSLAFDPISSTQVIVTGGFRWMEPERSDTNRFIYASLLSVVDSGLAIVFEHETRRPPR